jgi:hypothetical protein
MTVLSLLDAIERPSILGPDPMRDDGDARVGRDRHAELPVGGAPTLDDLLVAAWEALTAGHAAACVMCGGPVQPRFGAGPAPVAGRCTRCGTEIS